MDCAGSNKSGFDCPNDAKEALALLRELSHYYELPDLYSLEAWFRDEYELNYKERTQVETALLGLSGQRRRSGF